ncbi:oxygenase MpaB family protein [soil metagenome]
MTPSVPHDSGVPAALPMLNHVRSRVGAAIFARVAGDDGPANRDRIHLTPGPRWFAADAPIRQVHGDASMFVGGLRALLLQSLHPLAMAGVAGHSGFRGDPWGRLQRTSTFLAVTTFGTAEHAELMIERVRAVHSRIRGTTPEGQPYAASDPRLLGWVHIAEIDSFLRAHQVYGSSPLDTAGCDRYIAETGRVAEALGVVDPPRNQADLAAQLAVYRPELRGTPAARDAARFLLLQAPLPLPARRGYGVLAAAAVGLMPRWTRWPLRLPYLPLAEATVVRAAGWGITSGIRFALTPPPSREISPAAV